MNMKHNLITLGLAGAVAVVFVPSVQAQSQPTPAVQKSKVAPTGTEKRPKTVNNAVCPVSDEAIGSMGEGVNVIYKDSIITLCCKGCAKKFNANPEAYLKKAKSAGKLPSTAQNRKRQSAKKSRNTQSMAGVHDIKNANCPVSGKAIGSMGSGVAVSHNGYQVTLCCAGCKGRFEANPDQYLRAAMNDVKRP